MAYLVTKHDQKFDRQMRLWGGHGQKKLEEAHLCVLGSGPTASECLKNLVLPNVGKFTIVDDVVTSEADLGNNFFVDQDGIGKPRAEVVTTLLVEMNNAAKGEPVVKNPIKVIEDESEFFKDFSVVIACNIPEKPLLTLGAICYKKEIPLVVLAAYGLLGYARLQIPEHPVIESHYENDRYDLFVHPEQLKHFDELKTFIDKFGKLDEIKDTMEHAHVPYVVILSKAMDAYREKNGGMPKTYEQQKQFKADIKAMANTYEGDNQEENFHEAVAAANRVYTKPTLSYLSQCVLDDAKTEITPDSNNFWILIAAVKRFLSEEGKGCLPCSVKIPDMTSTPESYVELGNIYKARALRDEGLIAIHARAILSELGREEDSITDEAVGYVVKNLRGIHCVRTGSLVEEYNSKTFPTESVKEIFEEWMEEPEEDALPNPRIINWYFAYRAVQQFHTKNGRYPGTLSEGKEPDIDGDCKELVIIQSALYEELGITEKVEEICLQSMVRFGATELHNIAAYIGGVGSQIVLKTIIQQYVPLDNTYIFNGTHGAGQVFKV